MAVGAGLGAWGVIERLKVLHDILNPDKFFSFSYKDLKPRESTKKLVRKVRTT